MDSMKKVVLQTERLVLRQMTDQDFDGLASVLMDDVNMRFYPKPFDADMVTRWLEWAKGCYQKRGFGLWAVVLKQDGRFIGDCGITFQNINGSILPEIGYHLARAYAGQGFASEAAQACKAYAFERLGFEEIYSYMTADNIASRRVAEKNGMRLVDEYVDDGVLHTVYRVTRQEYEAAKRLAGKAE